MGMVSLEHFFSGIDIFPNLLIIIVPSTFVRESLKQTPEQQELFLAI